MPPRQPMAARPITRPAMDALRRLQGCTRGEAAEVMQLRPDCVWLRRAMTDPETSVVSLGLFWVFHGPEGRWPVVAWWVTWNGTRRTVLTFWQGRWVCQTRATDAVSWDQYAGVPDQRPAWRDGEEGPSVP